MATHRTNSNINLDLIWPAATMASLVTDALPSNPKLEDFLGSHKVSSLQSTAHSSTSLVGSAYSQVTEYQPTGAKQPVAENLLLHPALFNELRALQIEGGFQTTSDLLHHLVISEKVRRVQLQQSTSRHNHDKNLLAFCQTTVSALVNSSPSIDHVNSQSINNSSLSTEPIQGIRDTGQIVRLSKANIEASLTNNALDQVNLNCAVYSKTVSVGLQVNLCRCKIKDEPLDELLNKCNKGVSSTVKKKMSSSDHSYSQSAVVKETVENINGETKILPRRRSHLYPKHRMPKDTKSATRRKQEYLCEICGMTFKWRRSLIPHMWEHRKEVSVHRCPHCNTSFPYACRLKRHLIAKHPDVEGGPIRCSTCGVEVQSYATLRSHMRIHTGYKPFKCKFCPKTYKWNTGLEYHERVHTGERPFPCPLCSKAFTNKSDLTRHRTVHTGEKPHVCKKCGKGFTQSHTLKSHCRKCHFNASPPLSSDCRLNAQPKSSLPVPSSLLPSPYPVQQQTTFMLSNVQDHTSVSNCLEPFKFVSDAGLPSIQRQISGVSTEREIAEVVVSMLTHQ